MKTMSKKKVSKYGYHENRNKKKITLSYKHLKTSPERLQIHLKEYSIIHNKQNILIQAFINQENAYINIL
jgi:hypothetical protein